MGYSLILKIRRIEEECHDMGFRLGNPKYGRDYNSEDCVAVYPRDTELPVFARDSELFSGTISQLDVWLAGVKWARRYDMLTRVSNDSKRKVQEDKERERQRLAKERAEKKRMFEILSNKEPQNG